MRVLADHKPFIHIDTPLKSVPRVWLELFEPKVRRGYGEYPSCWLWADAIGSRDCAINGEPRMRMKYPDGKTRVVLVKHVVAEMFWPQIQCRGHKPRHYVYHECGSMNCINPNHFLVTYETKEQFNLEAMVKKKQASLRNYKRQLDAVAP